MTDEKPISRQLKSYRKLRNSPKYIAAKARKAAKRKKRYATDDAFRARCLAALARWRKSKGIKPRKTHGIEA